MTTNKIQQWYVKDDEGKIFGPFENKEDAEYHADLIDALVVTLEE